MRRALLLSLIACLAPALCSAQAVEKQPMVASVRVVSDGHDTPEEVIEVLGLRLGEPLDRRQIRRGIHALVAAGDVSRLEVRDEGQGRACEIVVEVDVVPRLAVLEIVAPSMLWRFRAQRWLDIDIGDAVNADRIDSAVQRVRRRLLARGFADATVEADLAFRSGTNAVAATITVEPGPPARLADLRIEGLPAGVEARSVRPKVSRGERLKLSVETKIQDQVETRMRELGYWEARVSKVTRRSVAEGVDVVVSLEAGPRFRIQIIAPPGSEELVREAIPDPAREDLNPAQTAALSRRIEEGLQMAGRLLAEVDVGLGGEDGEVVVTIDAEPDLPRVVASVEFPGAVQMPVKELREMVTVQEGNGGRRRPVSRATLESDRAALQKRLRELGFVEAVIGEPRMVAEGERGVTVIFPVEEGIRWTVDAFRVGGVPPEAAWAVDDDAYQMEVTEAWDAGRLEDLVARWERALADAGYPEAEMSAQIDTPDPGRVQVALWAESGDFVRFGRVILSGLHQTDRGVIEKILDHAGLVSGEPFSQATIIRAQQELYRLGIFRRVGVVPIPGHELRKHRGVIVSLEEGFQKSYLVGLGWGTEDNFRLTLGWTHLNLFGGAHAFSLETRFSSRELRFQASLREPLLPLINRPGVFAIYQTEEIFTDYDQLRRGLWFEIGDRMKAPFRHWLRYEYQVVEPNAPAVILSDLERNEQQIELSSITPSVEWDFRDDLLNPRSGLLVSLAPEFAFKTLSAETEFVKFRGSLTQYFKTPRGKLALGLRLGGIWPSSLAGDQPANLQVPLAVRFFAGGSTTHRAFRTDRLGIPGQTLDEEGAAIGGNAMALVNAEYQHSVWGDLAAVVFVDGGNIWAEPDDVSFDDFRWGVGAGMRFDTAAGPLRVEYGHKLEKLEGESSGELFVSFGVAF